MYKHKSQKYAKYTLAEFPKVNKTYFDSEGNKYSINKLGQLLYKNKVIDNQQLKVKYGKVHLDLYSPDNYYYYDYKGKDLAYKQICSQSPISVTIKHPFLKGFPIIFNLRLEDNVSKIYSPDKERKMRLISKQPLIDQDKNNLESEDEDSKRYSHVADSKNTYPPSKKIKKFLISKFTLFGKDITNYKGTFKQFLEENRLYSPSQSKYDLCINCEVELKASFEVTQHFDEYKYYFASHDADNEYIYNRLRFTLEEDELEFVTFIGFGKGDKHKLKEISDVSYEEKTNQIRDLLWFRGIASDEIERLTFKEIKLCRFDAQKFAIEITVNQKIQDKVVKKLNLGEDCYSESDNNSIITADD